MKTYRIAAVAALALLAPRFARAQDDCEKLLPPGLSFPKIRSDLPFAATFPAMRTLDNDQKAFDLFAWSSFVALNWPGNPDGTLMPGGIGDNPGAARVWERYIGASQVFKPDGSKPDPWGGANSFLAENVAGFKAGQKVLFSATKMTSDAAADLSEVGQASFGSVKLPPIADLNRKYVFYEIHLNRTEYDYVVAHALYNQNGQTAFLAANSISFPSGTNGDPRATPPVKAAPGATEIKAAWKVLGPGDDPTKFYAIKATMIDPVTHQPVPDVAFGLVGLHIITRTASAPQWVWATFEHVDNAPDVGETKLAPHYNFNDPTAPQPAGGFAAPPMPTTNPMSNPSPSQITRVLNNANINSDWTKCLNATMQKQLAGTVWANYRLITTQWPTPGASDGKPFIPLKVANTTLETYVQASISCMNCHAAARTSGKASNGTAASANFSYLLQAAQPVATTAEKASARVKVQARDAAARQK